MREIPEKSSASRLRQNGRQIVLLFQKSLIIDKDEEESLILHDRSAQAAAELISILETLRSAGKLLEPWLSRELRVVVRVEQGAVVFVAAGARSHLHLRGSAPERRINIVRGDADFFDHVGTGVDGRVSSVGVVISPVVGNQAVARGVHLADGGSTEVLHGRVKGIDGRHDGWCGRNQVQYVAARQRQIRHYRIRKYISNRSGRGRNQRIRGNRHFDVLRSGSNLEREVQSHLLALAQHDIVIGRVLESGERG